MTQAMFSRTGSDQFPSWLKCMVTGPPKSGKTTLLGTVPNILILDTEPHANNLQSVAHLDIPFKAIHSTNDLRQSQFILSQEQFRKQAAQSLGMPDIEAVAIDTLDTLQAIMKRERMKEQRTNKFLRDDWGWLKEELTSILESFLALPMHVFFIVHTKSENVGTEDNPRTVILPGLEGSIARQIAGMVGYSLLSFRKEEIKPDGSGKYTKYWLRAEGDETYEYLGNRAAGRLPDIIEPDFQHLLDAAMANRPTQQHAQIAVDLGAQRSQQAVPQQAPAQTPVDAPPPPQQQAPVQTPVETAPVLSTATGEPVVHQQELPPQPQQQPAVAQDQGQPQQQASPTNGVPQTLPPDTEPVNAAALGHVKRVYDACGLAFPEEQIKALNLGQARDIVRAYKAIAEDDAAGNTPQGQTPAGIMTDYLAAHGLVPQQVEAPKVVTPNVRGTIPEVKAYVEQSEDGQLNRASEAYEIERQGQGRKTLMEWLESKGATGAMSDSDPAPVQTPVETPQAPEAPQEQPPTPAEQPQEAVTPEAPAADGPSEEEAVAVLEEKLGAVEVISPDSKCEECGNQVDDVDLAQLGRSRFKRTLCVADYIAETKKKPQPA